MELISGDDQLSGHLHGQWTIDTPLTTSDRRFKKDIQPIERFFVKEGQVHSPGEIFRRLRPVSFAMTDDEANRNRFGFIAQELEEVLPNVVVSTTGKPSADAAAEAGEGTKAVLYQDLIALLTAVVQQQQQTIDKLVAQMNELTNPNAPES
jgi:hypothetical protein